jgi:hypothetical protein
MPRYKAKGNTDSSADHRMLTSALKRELARKSKGDLTAAVRIAQRVVREAEKGAQWAAALCFDRLEGKAIQAVRLGQDEDAPPVSITVIPK